MDLSVLIPARKERWLSRTVDDVLKHAKGATEVVVVCDGGWADPPIQDHPRVRVIRTPSPIGQRAGVNLAAKLARGRYVMKLDGHCSVPDGFDVQLVTDGDALGYDVTQIPRMYNLHVFNWQCSACGHETYQGRTPVSCDQCKKSGQKFELKMIWQHRKHKKTEFWYFDHDLHFQYYSGENHSLRWDKRPEARGDICDVMSSVGACFVMRRERFFELGGLDESHGSWGQFGVEIACKSWLSGGRHVVNKRTWFAHLFRTQGGDFGFPYEMRGADQERARQHSRDLWMHNKWPGQKYPLSWLIEKFGPIQGWHEKQGAEALAKVMAEGRAFYARTAATSPTTAA
jgi:glycosyltransferase involved in cell wall biosynthesis